MEVEKGFNSFSASNKDPKASNSGFVTLRQNMAS